MKNLTSYLKKGILLTGVLCMAYSCSDDDTTAQEVTLSQTELKAVLETDEIIGDIDLALFELSSNDSSTGKTSYNDCYSAVYSDTGYVATFNNCVLNGTDNVNGTLNVTYDQQGETGSFTASYVDFYVGEIKINGTTNISTITLFSTRISGRFCMYYCITLLTWMRFYIELLGSITANIYKTYVSLCAKNSYTCTIRSTLVSSIIRCLQI